MNYVKTLEKQVRVLRDEKAYLEQERRVRAITVKLLKEDHRALLFALHEAIQRPLGFVPQPALRFYDPEKFYGEDGL